VLISIIFNVTRLLQAFLTWNFWYLLTFWEITDNDLEMLQGRDIAAIED